MVGSTLIQWQRSNFKITGVVFFVTAPYFCLRSQNFTVVWLWAAITPVQNLTRPISSTFSESSGRQLSDGPILDFFSLSKFRGTSVLWEKAFFCIFAWPHRENFQKIYNRTILKFDALPIAHIEADVPLFSKHLWKLAIRLKLWVLAHSEVSWSRTMTAKMSVFRPLFWRKSLFWPILTQKCFKCYTWLESYGSPLYDDRKKKKIKKIL